MMDNTTRAMVGGAKAMDMMPAREKVVEWELRSEGKESETCEFDIEGNERCES